MNSISKALAVTIVAFSVFASAFGQETEETVVDEVVAQVNESVITLSQVNREMEVQVRAMMGQGKSKEEAEAEASKNRGQMIANLITEEMLRQKGVEIGLEKSVDAEVNQRLLRLTKDNNLNSINDLFKLMRDQGVDPDLLKNSWRSEIMKQQVMMNMVDRVVYWGTSDKEVKEYYEKNKEKFVQQETVTLSEIFLSFAGKNEADVIALANSVTQRARKGEDFSKLAVEYSDRPNVAETNGVVGTFPVAGLDDVFREGIKDLRTGGIADPIKLDIGMEIIRVDKYTPASSESNFDENLVRSAILEEKAPKARDEFLKELKDDSYIKVRENYRGLVMPFLRDAPADESTSSTN